MSLGIVDLPWLVAGVVAHLCSQLARGRGWHALVCAAHAEADRPRCRHVLAAWVGGAGASGVFSSRGGDVVRVMLLRRRMDTTWAVLVGTIAAETVAETVLGVGFTAWALSAGLVPGLPSPGDGTVALIAAATGLAALAGRRLWLRSPRVRRAVAEARCGLAMLGRPREYARRVVPWGLFSRALRLGALACFLAAFSLPVTLAGVVLVMVVHSGGRLVPFAPASAGASLAMLTVSFPAVTGAAVSGGQLATFYFGMTGVLTVVGVGLSTLLMVHALGIGGAWQAGRGALERARLKPAPVRPGA